MLKYKAIIFDFDGVIVDSVNIKTKAFAQLYSPFGEQVVRKVINHHELHGGISRFEKLAHYHKTFLNTELNEIELTNLAQVFSSLVFEKVVAAPYILGAEEFLKRYCDRLQFFIATGTPMKEVEKIAEARKLHGYFEELYGSPMEKAECIRIILKKYQFKKTDVLFVGDAKTDFEAAKKFNIDFVGVRNERTNFPEGTFLIDSIMELNNLLKLAY
jgi:phosphoglycolate phosphatase-like HAD superfamily hydrolase